MADVKISALPASTTPLAGTEVLPIVQSGVTKQVSVANLTAGRSVSMGDATLSTGNLVIGTSGKGIDFSATANSGGTMTSELFADYEEGTWTPTDVSGAGLVFTNVSGNYRKVGSIVFANFTLKFPANTDATNIQIGGIPFSTTFDNGSGGTTTYTDYNSFIMLSMSTTKVRLYGASGASLQNLTLSGKYLEGVLIYPA